MVSSVCIYRLRPLSIIEATAVLSVTQAVEPGAMTSKCAASATTIVVTSSPFAIALSP